MTLMAAFCDFASAVPPRDTYTRMISPDLKSLQVRNIADENLPAVLSVPGDGITVDFDILAQDRDYLKFRIIHCNADWKPSGLSDAEMLDGFNYFDIDYSQYSSATTVPYVHYQFLLSEEILKPKVSGNFLVEIFPENDPDNVLATARFAISENSLQIHGTSTSRTDVDFNQSHQQLAFSVTDDHESIFDLYNDLIVEIQPNQSQTESVYLRHPLRTSGRKAIFEHLPALIFPAGNEYRRFETVWVNQPSQGVEFVEKENGRYSFFLYPDEPHAASSYSYDETQRGRFLIRSADARSREASDTEADYGVVIFRLKLPPDSRNPVYLLGSFNGEIPDGNSSMTYNPEAGEYEKSYILKQGAYTYRYARGDGKGNLRNNIDGDKYQTVNEYTIKVYHRRRGEHFDRLAACSVILSGQY